MTQPWSELPQPSSFPHLEQTPTTWVPERIRREAQGPKPDSHQNQTCGCSENFLFHAAAPRSLPRRDWQVQKEPFCGAGGPTTVLRCSPTRATLLPHLDLTYSTCTYPWVLGCSLTTLGRLSRGSGGHKDTALSMRPPRTRQCAGPRLCGRTQPSSHHSEGHGLAQLPGYCVARARDNTWCSQYRARDIRSSLSFGGHEFEGGSC